MPVSAFFLFRKKKKVQKTTCMFVWGRTLCSRYLQNTSRNNDNKSNLSNSVYNAFNFTHYINLTQPPSRCCPTSWTRRTYLQQKRATLNAWSSKKWSTRSSAMSKFRELVSSFVKCPRLLHQIGHLRASVLRSQAQSQLHLWFSHLQVSVARTQASSAKP